MERETSPYEKARQSAEQGASERLAAATEERALYEFAKAHPEIRWCQAAEQVIRDFFRDTPITSHEDIEFAYSSSTLADWLKPLMWSEGQRKQALVAEYLNLNKGRMSPDSYKGFSDHFRKEVKHLSADQIQQRIEALETKIELSKKSVPELRKIVRTEKGFPALPVSITRFQLESLAKSREGRESFRRLLQKYGRDQINKRLATPYEGGNE